MLVIDASVTLPWAFLDETTPYTEGVLRRVTQDGALVPALWAIEVANALLAGERRGRVSPDDTSSFLARLGRLPITADEQVRATWGAVLALARAHRLTAYDASYLELAVRRGLPLATYDGELRSAAARVGVPLVQ